MTRPCYSFQFCKEAGGAHNWESQVWWRRMLKCWTKTLAATWCNKRWSLFPHKAECISIPACGQDYAENWPLLEHDIGREYFKSRSSCMDQLNEQRIFHSPSITMLYFFRIVLAASTTMNSTVMNSQVYHYFQINRIAPGLQFLWWPKHTPVESVLKYQRENRMKCFLHKPTM